MIRNRTSLAKTPARKTALACLEAALEASDPVRIVEEKIVVEGSTIAIDGARYDLSGYEEVIVLGGGNAAGRVALALESVLGDRLNGGIVVTDDPHETDRIEVLPGDHPVPTERGVDSTRALVARARDADEHTLVLAVVTGGGSALMAAPSPDVPLDELRAVTESLLASGATIDEINAVRKHCSTIKGGGLARAASPATVVGLVFSDVVGNDLSVIASGPISPDSSTFSDALAVLDRYDIDAPDAILTRLTAGANGDREETPRPGDPVFDRVSVHVLADGFTPLAGAREVATERGYEPIVLSSRVRGEALEAAKTHAAIAEEIRATGNPVTGPAVVLSGGETTVTIRGDGTGGPNQEFALSAAIELEGFAGFALASVDTDGIDGATEVAGALVDGETADGESESRTALEDNDSYTYLEGKGALLETGPTGTNLNDFRVLVVESRDHPR